MRPNPKTVHDPNVPLRLRARGLRAGVAAAVLALAAAPALACAPADDLAAVAAVRARIERIGALVWPGWTAPPPVLLRSGDGDCLIAHPAPPSEFAPAGDGMARLDGHLLPVPAATALPVGGVWSLVAPARDELQAFVDEHLGPGVVVLDEALYARTLAHEAFHAFQLTSMGGPAGVPAFGDGPAAALADIAAHPAFAAVQAEQGVALVAALEAPTAGEAVAAIARFLSARDGWRAAAPTGTAATERQLEWLEGTARYADVLLALVPAPEPLGDPAAVWRELRDQARDPAAIASGPRDGYAALGAAQAFVLDRLDPGWRARAIPGGRALEDLLRAVVEGGAGVPVALRGMPLRTVTLGGVRWRVAVADVPEAWTQGLQGVVRFGAVDGLWFVFPEDVRAPFWMRGAAVPLDIAFFDGDGLALGAFAMPTCDADPCPTYRPDAPYRSALEALGGRLAGRGGVGVLRAR